MAVTIYVIIASQYELRKIIRFIGRLFWQWRIEPPLSRADARAQVQFLNQLPIYRIKIEKHGSPAAPPSEATAIAVAQAPLVGYLQFPESIDPTSRPYA